MPALAGADFNILYLSFQLSRLIVSSFIRLRRTVFSTPRDSALFFQTFVLSLTRLSDGFSVIFVRFTTQKYGELFSFFCTAYVKELVDADRCFAYKTLIAVKIEEVVHVFGKLILHKNDVVLISSFDGLSGGCSPNYDPEKETRQITMPYRHFKKGDYDLFLLNRYFYDILFMQKNNGYNDTYCPNMFRITDDTESTLNENINESVDDIKRFFKEN